MRPAEIYRRGAHQFDKSQVILRMNALLNELMANEVGKNDGSFLPKEIRPQPG
jgi:hypothetical protein